MAFTVKNVLDLCEAAKKLGNGAASSDSIAMLIAAAQGGESIEELLRQMLVKARHDLVKHKEPALQVERWARIAGLTGEDKDFEKAIGLIPGISHPCARARAKGFIVQAYLDAGMTDRAREFAGDIKSKFWGAEAYIAVFKKSNNLHDKQQAENRCSGINDPLAREEVEAQINAL